MSPRHETKAKPRVSVVIPVFNSRTFITETVTSVLHQSVDEVEVLVVDDGSTDDSPALVTQLAASDPRISLHRFPNAGAPTARNRGLRIASAPHIAFLDADDLWHTNKLERQLEAFASDPELVVVGALMDYVSATGRRLGETAQTPDKIDIVEVRRGALMPFPLSSALFRTDVVREVGGSEDLFPSSDVPLSEDLHLLAKVAAHGKLACLREPLGAYRVYDASASGRRHTEMFASGEYVRRVLEDPSFRAQKSWDSFLAEYRPSGGERRSQLAQVSYRRGAIALLERRWSTAAAGLGRAFFLRPRYTVRRAWRQLVRS